MTAFGKNKALILSVLALVFIIFFGFAALSHAASLVPCGVGGGKECTICDLLVLAKDVVDFLLLKLGPAIATILFLWAGFMILLGGGNPKLVTSGRKIFETTVWGLVIMYAAWLVANTTIRSLAGDSKAATSWNTLECKETVKTAGTTTTPTPTAGGDSCSDLTTLAKEHNEPFPAQNARELDDLIKCIKRELPYSDLGSEFTFDETHKTCNYTRGDGHCSATCSHSHNSCHYGGKTGQLGALAVDFGNEKIGEEIIKAAVKECGAKSARCETPESKEVSCVIARPEDHVHVNSKSCDRN